MSVLSSLPDRPLKEAEVASLNRSEGVDLAVATEQEGPTAGLVLATDGWVKGLAFEGSYTDAEGFEGAWTVVKSAVLDDTDRFEAMRTCEDAVLDRLDAT